MKITLIGVTALAVSLAAGLAGTDPARAEVLGTETDNGGFVGTIPGTSITVASDGEAAFDPFGFGFDTSDSILFGNSGSWTFIGQPGWQALSSSTWVLPADLSSIGCGQENETSCEPLGKWLLAGVTLQSGVFTILSADGAVSDTIILANELGGTTLSFTSDPGPVPLPAALPLFATGLGALGLLGWRRKRKLATEAAA